jgi:Ser/Thr protein kinase RdoA (MazF antagonist)
MQQFANLTPDYFLPFLEQALDVELTALARPLPSYINRVYEVLSRDNTYFIAKFYRPGRWSYEAIKDEHAFLLDCAELDIPVVCPIELKNGDTVNTIDKSCFAVFPKRAGRQYDVDYDENWKRIGTMLGRLHNAGQKRSAPSRLTLTPQTTTVNYVTQLIDDVVTERWRQPYQDICMRIIDTIAPYFEHTETIRIHGDFHSGNILHRPGEGLLVIDFDDMMNGPPVQDFWLLVPEPYPASRDYLDIILTGYRQFRDFDPKSFMLIEGLRAMRIIYFTAWCSMQRNDNLFQNKFPNWGSDKFWSKEVQDLRAQYATIMESLSSTI